MPRIEWLFNRRLLALTLGLLVVAGLSAINTLPRAEDPHLVARMATVLAPFPGATPEQIEALVARPIEDELRTIAEIKVLESTSRPGIAVISLELEDSVTQVVPIWSRVRDKLSDIAPSLPSGVQTPELLDDRGYAFSLVAALRWTQDTPPQRPTDGALRRAAGRPVSSRGRHRIYPSVWRGWRADRRAGGPAGA
ncbi:efflux RND transporter permease subunit [Halomonas sp. BC1]|uniref:efflux RND transporter permease subunit n=1 Tax=Halomonas sp. BC1 TaxID=1670448 RepID=UPI0020CB12B6|nr:efflux RND transporter permease subunit [Halomonas sp. BC1]